MRTITGFFISFCIFLIVADGQEHKAQLLKEPASWEFERFSLPPQFAPGISYKGFEELRFAPGMFNKDSATYFTYAFVAELENIATVSQVDIRSYLQKYYKGLCSATAHDRKLEIDTTRINVTIVKKKDTSGNEAIYDAVLNIFGVFADGAPVSLNMEIKVMVNAGLKKTYLLFIASPRQKKDAVWHDLYAIQKNFAFPD